MNADFSVSSWRNGVAVLSVKVRKARRGDRFVRGSVFNNNFEVYIGYSLIC